MTTVLGLDLSLTATGVADIDGTPSTLTSSLTGPARLHDLRNQVDRLTHTQTTCRVSLVAIEGYAMGSARQSHSYAIGELGGVIRHRLWMHNLPFVEVPPALVKKYATGKGNAPKDLVLVEAVKRLGYEGSSKDEADALWLRALVLDALGEPVVTVPAAHREALAKVQIPEGVARA